MCSYFSFSIKRPPAPVSRFRSVAFDKFGDVRRRVSITVVRKKHVWFMCRFEMQPLAKSQRSWTQPLVELHVERGKDQSPADRDATAWCAPAVIHNYRSSICMSIVLSAHVARAHLCSPRTLDAWPHCACVTRHGEPANQVQGQGRGKQLQSQVQGLGR